MASRITRPRLLALAAVLAVPVGLTAFVRQHPAIIVGAKLFESVLLATSDRYVKDVPVDSLYLYAARGMVRELNDPFSELLAPQEMVLFSRQFGQTYEGIGTSAAGEPGGVVFVQVLPGAPAERAGIRVGDKLVRIDSLDVQTWNETRVREQLVGPGGSAVSLTVLREGEPGPLTFVVTRGNVHPTTVPYTRMLDHQVGYVPLTAFRASASDEVRAAAAALVRAGAKRLILDLRFNPGGVTDQAVAVSNLFLPEGKTVLTERWREGDRTYATTHAPAYPDIPLVVLVNGATASSSEIVAGALQDDDRALLVGTTTFGKGVGQSTIPVEDGYVLKLTVMEWVTPLGRSIHKARGSVPRGAPAIDSSNGVESDSSVRARPRFTTGTGRTVYGGGGIVPDALVPATETSGDAKLLAAIRSSGHLFYAATARYAATLRGKIERNFNVTPVMRSEVLRRLRADGLVLDAATVAGGRRVLDDMIASQIALALAADSVVPRQFLAADPQLRRALTVLGGAQNQADVFAAAARVAAAPTASTAGPVPMTRPRSVKPAHAKRR